MNFRLLLYETNMYLNIISHVTLFMFNLYFKNKLEHFFVFTNLFENK